MNRNWQSLLPIYGVERNCILSRQGHYTVGYQVKKAEIFTLSGQEYQEIHQAFVRAIRVLPPGSILHLQDWYTNEKYRTDEPKEDPTFLSQASERFFNERPWFDHSAYIFITRRARAAVRPTSALSGLIYPRSVSPEATEPKLLNEFLSCCAQFVRILEDSGFLKLEALTAGDIWSTTDKIGLVERYCSLESGRKPVLKDIAFEQGIRIGDQHCQLFSLADAEDLPPLCGPRINYDAYSTDRTKFSVGFASGLGPLLLCNHICNQYVFIDTPGDTLKRMEIRNRRLKSFSAYSRENTASQEATNAFLNEAVADQRLPVQAHFNVLTWTDQQHEIAAIKSQTSAALARLEATPRLETIGAPQIWFAGIPGNEGDFPMNDTFDTFAEQAACFFQVETNYRSSVSPFGVRLGDRLSGRPLHVDIDKQPKAENLIGNGNTFILSGSGGGKSFFTNHLVRSYYEQGMHILIIDVGHSYQLQCELHGGFYFTYHDWAPIRFNPFFVAEGDSMDTEKRESLKTLLVALWKGTHELPTRSEYVAVSAALQLYFEKIDSDPSMFPCFNTFYEFLRIDFRNQIETEEVKSKEFDLANFLYTLKPYYRGGEFDYLLNASENLDLLQQRFIVFELDNIKDHPILFPVVTLIIMELFVSKMRKLKGVMKAIVIEEAWKPIAKGGMAEYIKYLFKTVRKFNAKAIVVTQEVEDIVSSEIIKNAIINNSDIKILLDQSKFQNKFSEIQELLGITDKQKAEILSINKGHAPGARYKDLWIGLGATHSRVYRLEVSPEEYYIYTSDQQEKELVRQYAAKYGSLKLGVRILVAEMKKRFSSKTPLLAGLFLTTSMLAKAQDPISILTGVVSRVIKAVDLQVQRIQTQTIWLEDAQKVVENAMTELDLDEIREWVQDQKDLYGEYFNELKEVKTVVSYYDRISEIVTLQEKILASYKQTYGLLSQDPHFSPTELAHMASVYSGMIGNGANILDNLNLVIKSLTTQMTDEQRLKIINNASDAMEKLYLDLQRFNNQNALLSLQRAGDANEIAMLKKLYGL